VDSWRRLAPEELARLARALGSLRWSWSVAEVDRVLSGLGWQVAAGPSEAGLVARTGLAPFDGLAEIGFDGGGTLVTDISVPLTDGTPEESDAATDFRRDAFAAAARVLTGEFGAPAQRLPGAAPEIRWAVASGVGRLRDDGVFVSLALLSKAYARALDAERELDEP
jgi:hypothetical protein